MRVELGGADAGRRRFLDRGEGAVDHTIGTVHGLELGGGLEDDHTRTCAPTDSSTASATRTMDWFPSTTTS